MGGSADDGGYSDSLEGQRSALAYTTLMADPSLKHVGSNTAYVFLFSFVGAVFPEGWRGGIGNELMG